jgi:hypothetical protein
MSVSSEVALASSLRFQTLAEFLSYPYLAMRLQIHNHRLPLPHLPGQMMAAVATA